MKKVWRDGGDPADVLVCISSSHRTLRIAPHYEFYSHLQVATFALEYLPLVLVVGFFLIRIVFPPGMGF
jgi:hypothetical protein